MTKIIKHIKCLRITNFSQNWLIIPSTNNYHKRPTCIDTPMQRGAKGFYAKQRNQKRNRFKNKLRGGVGKKSKFLDIERWSTSTKEDYATGPDTEDHPIVLVARD